MKYYPIDEGAARRAKEANSFSEYREGSATEEYRAMVNRVYEIADIQKAQADKMYHDRIDALADSYARRLAENINRRNEIDARVPSVLIAGASNFPVRAKEKQNLARDRNDQEYLEIRSIPEKIKATGRGGISSDDPNAREKLEAKLRELEQAQEYMKAVNAYYRAHKTLAGCPQMSAEAAAKLDAAMARDWVPNPVPFESWALSNNAANIRRVKGRLLTLDAEREKAGSAGEREKSGDGWRLIENAEAGRIQFLFDGKPDEDIRNTLKGEGFRWAPSAKAWQRMLNDNGRRAAARVIEKIS